MEGGRLVGRYKKGLDLLLCFLKGIKLVLIFIPSERREDGGRRFFFAFFWFVLA